MSRSQSKSTELYNRALNVVPGGVNSPVRAFKSVGGNPLFMSRGTAESIFDVDGNKYIDYVMSWGPLLFGHAPPHVIAAIANAAQHGTSFGASTLAEVELAEAIVSAVPSIEKVRLVNSGTEAVMSAVRVARGFTKRNKIIKFEGNYHGHSDGFLSKAGSGLATFGLPDSAGVPASLTVDTLTLPYNNAGILKDAMSTHGADIACVIMEPVAGNMGVVPPMLGFLEACRELTLKHGALLIFDEVITGFRLALGGAQELYGVSPDLTTLGKIIGGGLPLAAYGGRAEVMDVVAPLGPVYQAGTLSGNPLAVAAGLAQVRAIVAQPDLYKTIDDAAAFLESGLHEAAHQTGQKVQVNRVGSMITVFFTGAPVIDYESAKRSDGSLYAKYFRAMLDNGVYLAPSQFEAAFLSTVHTPSVLTATNVASLKAMHELV